MEGSNGSQDAPGFPGVGRGVVALPVHQELHSGKLLPVASMIEDTVDDVFVSVEVTKCSGVGSSSDEWCDTFRVEGVACVEAGMLAEDIINILIYDFIGTKEFGSEFRSAK